MIPPTSYWPDMVEYVGWEYLINLVALAGSWVGGSIWCELAAAISLLRMGNFAGVVATLGRADDLVR